MKYLFLLLFLFASCHSEQGARGEFFSGMFARHDGGAVLTDCATGVTVPVSDESAYPSLEAKYLRTASDPGEAVYVELQGRIGSRPRPEGEGTESVVIVDSLVTLDRTRRCGSQRLLAGVYEARTNTGRRLLRLKPDYTFSETQFTESGEETSAGRWWRSAELELVLEETSPGTSEQSFQLIPPQEALTRNSGGGPLVYKKVYL